MFLRVTQSPHSVAATADRLVAALGEREITMFARIDHAGEARAAGLELPDEQLVIFGDPRAGTLLMQLDPEIGCELPLRVLIWDVGGSTLAGYRPPTELAERYAVGGQAELLRHMTELIEALV